MKVFELGMYRGARIWEETFPETCFSPSSTLSETVSVRASPSSSAFASRPQSFCIEYKVALGGRIGYGLLGATFAPTRSDFLRFEAPVKNEAWTSFETPLYGIDTVLIGLPDYLARSALEGCSKYFTEQEPLTGGELSFVAAAFSEVGSSPDIFQRLAAANCHYFMTRMSADSSQDAAEYADLFAIVTK